MTIMWVTGHSSLQDIGIKYVLSH